MTEKKSWCPKTWTCRNCGNVNDTLFICLRCRKKKYWFKEYKKPRHYVGKTNKDRVITFDEQIYCDTDSHKKTTT